MLGLFLEYGLLILSCPYFKVLQGEEELHKLREYQPLKVPLQPFPSPPEGEKFQLHDVTALASSF